MTFQRLARMVMRALTFVVLAACNSFDGVQPPPPRATTAPFIHGFAFDGQGTLANQQILMKSFYGYGVDTVADSTGHFALPVTDLRPPFVLQGGFGVFSVGNDTTTNINITPFTTMQLAFMLGTDPGNWFQSLDRSGPDGNVDVRRFTPLMVLAAQSAAIESMHEDAGFDYEPVTMNFVTTVFKPGTSDPMAVQVTTFANNFGDAGAFEPILEPEGRACKPERVFAITDTLVRAFCPAFKSNLPDDTNPTMIVLGATNARNDSLQIRETSTGGLASVVYTRHDETAPYLCTSTCSGVTLAGVQANGNQLVTLDSTLVTQVGTNNAVHLLGSLLEVNHGPPRPPDIQCDVGLVRVVVVIDDGTQRQGCVTPGASGIYVNDGIQSVQIDAFDDNGGGFSLGVRSRGTQVLSVELNDYLAGNLYLCRGAACGTVAITPVNPNDGSYTIAFAGNTLGQIGLADGTSTGGPNATVTGDSPLQVFAQPAPDQCAVAPHDTLHVEIDGEAPRVLCIGFAPQSDPTSGANAYTFSDFPNDTIYTGNCYSSTCGSFQVFMSNEVATNLFVQLNFNDNYFNNGPLAQGVITSSGPDANGLYTLTINHAPFTDVMIFGEPGIRTGTVTGALTNITYQNLAAAQALKLRPQLRFQPHIPPPHAIRKKTRAAHRSR